MTHIPVTGDAHHANAAPGLEDGPGELVQLIAREELVNGGPGDVLKAQFRAALVTLIDQRIAAHAGKA
jgi:hypothetical protein